MDLKQLEERIRLLATEGIGGKRDLLPLYADGEALRTLVEYLAEPFRGKVDRVCSPESLGLVLGSMLAHELGVGLVVIRDSFLYQSSGPGHYADHREMPSARRQQGVARG